MIIKAFKIYVDSVVKHDEHQDMNQRYTFLSVNCLLFHVKREKRLKRKIQKNVLSLCNTNSLTCIFMSHFTIEITLTLKPLYVSIGN